MSDLHDGQMERRGQRTMRTVILSASVAVALCLGGPMSSVASAQSSGAPVLDSQRPDGGPIPAPVGHRQPQQKDLPPSVARDEGHTTAGEQAIDRSLNICRGC
jgi:hypothetical protein